MNQEIKKEWVAALRSGEYKQGNGRLRDENDEFCCWGVLCDLYDGNHGNINWRNGGEMFGFTGRPAEEVLVWAGIIELHIIPILIRMNDGDPYMNVGPKNFSEIADYIEKNL